MNTQLWWQNAVIYQVYPRSFYDSNGDGIGDLRGIAQKLDYIAKLGVDGVWISPFFQSPMIDFGYDISDYRAVDPIFGTLADFDALLEKAHSLGLKILIDQVLSHTSDQHAWFQESRSSRTNPKSDWYVWADPKPDGTPPNNWLAVFGGSAWQWDEGRQQYYLHNFLRSQPDLNFHNDALRAQILKEMRFWLDKGVDGFRLDAINYCYHDAQLRDNPVKPEHERKGRGFSELNPYAAQKHLYDNTQPENLGFMEEIRRTLDNYPSAVGLGEINTDDSLASIAEYTQPNRLHLGYSFELLADEFSPQFISETINRSQTHLQQRIPCWAISNHDVKRVVTRWGKQLSTAEEDHDAIAKLLTLMMLSLRGTICTYQGEELGLCEHAISREHLQDPFGIQFWPEFKGRDGCRTPMPWNGDNNKGGFTDGKPWLPLDIRHLDRSIAAQEDNPHSVLNIYRQYLCWRKQQSALTNGTQTELVWDKQTVSFTRRSDTQSLFFCFNLSNETATIKNPFQNTIEAIDQAFFSPCEVNDQHIILPKLGFFCAAVS